MINKFGKIIALLASTFLFWGMYGHFSVTFAQSETLESKVLKKSINYSIHLPVGYYSSEKTYYPVLYLLHGFSGDETNWTELGNAKLIADSLVALQKIEPFIIVMPDGMNSYYINDYKNITPYEDFFIKELLPYIENKYRIIRDDEERAICGNSMGGYGAIILTVKYPDIFSTCISLSPAVRNAEIFAKMKQAKYENNFAHLFGSGLNENKRITSHWKSNSPYYLIDNNLADNLNEVNWYISCGLQDFLLPAAEAFHTLLTQYNIDHEYVTKPGNHDWDYWQESLEGGLLYWGTILKKE